MRAMILQAPREPLALVELDKPSPKEGEILIEVHACGVCRTDLHVVNAELPHPRYPIIPGHQIIGTIEAVGQGVSLPIGMKVGVAWLHSACGQCHYCLRGQENLCDEALYTGYQVNGGFADYCIAKADFCFKIPEGYSDENAAPLLCAGLIGYRALRFTLGAKVLGLYGFGAAAHIILQVALHRGCKVFAFTRPGDEASQRFALELGATWSGDSTSLPKEPLDAAIIFAPVGGLVPIALQACRKGGCVVCAGIHMSDIPSFPYSLLWEERQIRSVANLTRQDGREFLEIASCIPLKTIVTPYPLEKANEALQDLMTGRLNGAAVIVP